MTRKRQLWKEKLRLCKTNEKELAQVLDAKLHELANLEAEAAHHAAKYQEIAEASLHQFTYDQKQTQSLKLTTQQLQQEISRLERPSSGTTSRPVSTWRPLMMKPRKLIGSKKWTCSSARSNRLK